MKTRIESKTGMLLTCFILLLQLFTACSPEAVVYQKDTTPEEDAGDRVSAANTALSLTYTVSPGGNSWVINSIADNGDVIYDDGVHNWTNLDHVIRTYFKTSSTGALDVGLNIKAPTGSSKIAVTVGDETKEVEITNTVYQVVDIGTFSIDTAGYQFIEIQGVEKSSAYIGDITGVLVGGAATTGGITYVEDDFYWGRRGPSVHLSYEVPENKDIKWFYNEVTIPQGEDIVGSYFMANGFGEGYFGMQVNSETERRILFSVWSPYDTQNPDDIPDDYKITLLGKGDGVTTGEFGNEGSGGQSYMVYNWTAGNTYKFLLKGEPSVNNSTDYTAYFYAPEVGDWQLIASFRRPYTSTYLTRPHSFLENFVTGAGYLTRKGLYGNQWVLDTQSQWHEMTRAKFTADATARSGARLDYAGGADGNTFFMQNCGFFSDNTTIDSYHDRTANGIAPTIDFSQLETPTIATAPTLLDKTGWEVSDFSSEATSGEGTNGFASLVLDGDGETYWHSCWTGCNQTYDYPHFLTIDTKQTQSADGVAFVQRNGSRKVKDIQIEVSTDNLNWTSMGTFVLQNTAAEQYIDFSQTTSFRYVKVTMSSAYDGLSFAAMAEVSPFVR
ncbi:DUF3472 domain-containing protein [Limibacter armeniacum]|uniref:DUF3472 domain-containing protein n=1 Tax=Limibacter armeniacum TaxID=466084 RepID=UPI002FE5D3D5